MIQVYTELNTGVRETAMVTNKREPKPTGPQPEEPEAKAPSRVIHAFATMIGSRYCGITRFGYRDGVSEASRKSTGRG